MRTLRQLLCMTVLTVLPTLCAASGRVIWDVSHTPLQGYDLDHQYRDLAALLSDNSLSLSELAEDLNVTGLWNADIFVVSALSNYETAYSAAEIALVGHFVQAGGGLIILADNNAARPRNLAELARQFGVLTSRDDRIGNLSQFIQNGLFAEIEEIAFASGSSLELVAQGGAEGWAADDADRIGIARKEAGLGKVVVVGDADLWTNDNLTQSDNSALALALFRYLDREARGRIDMPDSGTVQYLPVDGSYTRNFVIENNGDGLLEYRVTAPEGSPIDMHREFGMVAAGESEQIGFEISTDGLDPDRIFETQITVNHNDPSREQAQYRVELHTLGVEPSHFSSPAPTGIDHSLLITEITIEEEPAPAGLEVGVFTPGGYCAGARRYLGEALGIAVRGDDPDTDEIDGFSRDQVFRFMLYTPWDQRELAANAELIEGDARFTADGFSVFTLDGRSGQELTLYLRERWSLVSLNITPVSLAPDEILAPLLEENLLTMVKDGNGRFWDIARNFSNLGGWNLLGAYHIKVRQPGEITIFGAEVDATEAIPLRNGWNSVAYLPRSALPLEEALASLQGRLEIVKRGDGAFFIERLNWDGIGALEPGYGYQMRLSAAAELTYPEVDERAAASALPSPYGKTQSDRSMSLLALNLAPSSGVAAYYGDLLIGSGLADASSRVGMAVWGDDPATPELEGALDGGVIELLIDGERHTPSWREGNGTMRVNDVAVADFSRQAVKIPESFDIDLIPNPFNDRTLLKILNQSSELHLEIFDTAGRLHYSNHYDAQVNSGNLETPLPARQLPSGVLLIRVSGGGRGGVVKAIHLP